MARKLPKTNPEELQRLAQSLEKWAERAKDGTVEAIGIVVSTKNEVFTDAVVITPPYHSLPLIAGLHKLTADLFASLMRETTETGKDIISNEGETDE
jgi:hypothetical protein